MVGIGLSRKEHMAATSFDGSARANVTAAYQL
jgi:hypothetical protein